MISYAQGYMLLEAAAKGQLTTKEQVAKQAERMHADPQAKAKLREFLLTWARANHGLDLSKDPKTFPGFDAKLRWFRRLHNA